MAGPLLLLTDSEATEPAVSGAKGAALARMKQAGLPVPDAFILPTEAFRALVNTLPTQALNALREEHSDAAQIAAGALRDGALSEPWLDALRKAAEFMMRPRPLMGSKMCVNTDRID